MRPLFLFSHRGALGDFALTWPPLRRLRRRFPEHRFVGLGRPGHLELAIALGLLDEGLDAESSALLPFYRGETLPPALAGAAAALLWMDEDAAVRGLLRALPGPAVMHPPFPVRRSVQYPAHGPHVLEHHLAALAHFGGAENAQENTQENTREETPFSLDVARDPDLILLHPGSGSSAKNHAPSFYLELAERLRRDTGKRVNIVLGPVEAERGEDAFWRGRFPILAPSLPLDLAKRLAAAALYVGNDSGPAHVAALLGTPTLALYKSTDPAVWGVRGPFARSIAARSEDEAFEGVEKALISLRFGTK